MRARKFLAYSITTLLVVAGLVAAPSASAATSNPIVYASDYTPQYDQNVTLYFDGLTPNTEYSYGYYFEINGTVLPYDPGWVNPVGILGSITTDAAGRSTTSMDWYWFLNPEYSVYSGVFPVKIFVNTLNITPTSPSDLLGTSAQIYPGQNVLAGSVELSGPGITDNGFIPNETIHMNMSNFGAEITNVELIQVDTSNVSRPTDSWEAFFTGSNENSWRMEETSVIFGSSGFDFTLDESMTTSHILVQYFAQPSFVHAAGWIWVNHEGAISEAKEIIVPAEISETVKPFSYVKAAYGADIADDQIVITNAAYCTSTGDKIVFLAKGTCTWDVLDSDGVVVSSDSAVITSSADSLASTPLAHHTVKFAKKSKKLSKSEKRKILKLTDAELWDQVIVFGYSWKEGSRNKMNKLSQSRTKTVVDYLSTKNHTVVIFGGRGSQSPLYAKGKKQSLNRRVEIVEMPSDAQ